MAQVRAFLALLAAALVVSVGAASPAATRELVLRHVGRLPPRRRLVAAGPLDSDDLPRKPDCSWFTVRLHPPVPFLNDPRRSMREGRRVPRVGVRRVSARCPRDTRIPAYLAVPSQMSGAGCETVKPQAL